MQTDTTQQNAEVFETLPNGTKEFVGEIFLYKGINTLTVSTIKADYVFTLSQRIVK